MLKPLPLPSTSLSSFFSYFVETCVTILKFSTNQKLDYLSFSFSFSVCVLSILLYEHVRDVRWCIQMKWKLVYDYVFLTRHMGAYNVWHVLSQFQIPHLNHNFMFFCFVLGKREKKHTILAVIIAWMQTNEIIVSEFMARAFYWSSTALSHTKNHSMKALDYPNVCLERYTYIHKLGFNLKASEMYH